MRFWRENAKCWCPCSDKVVEQNELEMCLHEKMNQMSHKRDNFLTKKILVVLETWSTFCQQYCLAVIKNAWAGERNAARNFLSLWIPDVQSYELDSSLRHVISFYFHFFIFTSLLGYVLFVDNTSVIKSTKLWLERGLTPWTKADWFVSAHYVALFYEIDLEII